MLGGHGGWTCWAGVVGGRAGRAWWADVLGVVGVDDVGMQGGGGWGVEVFFFVNRLFQSKKQSVFFQFCVHALIVFK